MSGLSNELVFVYGTLRRGACNAFMMEGAKRLRTAHVRGRLYRRDGYPALLLDGGPDSWVVGDLWEVSPEKFDELNAYEEEAAAGDEWAEFELERIPVARQEADPDVWPSTEAWTWLWAGTREGLKQVPSGDWMDEEYPPKPPIFTGLGCVSLIAVPAGAAVMGRLIERWFGPGAINITVGLLFTGLVLVMTPIVASVLCRWAERRREAGEIFRSMTQGITWIWAFALLFLALMMLAEFMLNGN